MKNKSEQKDEYFTIKLSNAIDKHHLISLLTDWDGAYISRANLAKLSLESSPDNMV